MIIGKEDIVMRADKFKILKELGYTIKSINKHIKVIDSAGNIRVLSHKVLEQAADNAKYLKRIKNGTIWLNSRNDIESVYAQRSI